MGRVYVKDLKKGDVVIEQEYGSSITHNVLEDAQQSEKDGDVQWGCQTDVCYLLETEGMEHYGPKLYKEGI